ncbi:hypothetical protein [Methanosarcina sp. Kolksee]|uniref:hypothetical protein n=1 Tax=Methanosarcina sp. Kolksee TaxID=1434099 RepID=UPI0012E0BB2B|nr:hypothetical protein [Methanosarcina sp. Kolksee]
MLIEISEGIKPLLPLHKRVRDQGVRDQGVRDQGVRDQRVRDLSLLLNEPEIINIRL